MLRTLWRIYSFFCRCRLQWNRNDDRRLRRNCRRLNNDLFFLDGLSCMLNIDLDMFHLQLESDIFQIFYYLFRGMDDEGLSLDLCTLLRSRRKTYRLRRRRILLRVQELRSSFIWLRRLRMGWGWWEYNRWHNIDHAILWVEHIHSNCRGNGWMRAMLHVV